MLITLQSNSDSDANDFYNHFKETVIVKPNSELALVNCSYNYEGGITVDGTNNTFQVKLAKDVLRTITLTPGTYTKQSFITELTTNFTTFFTQTPYEIERAFRIEATADTTGILTLDFQYAPDDWDVLPIEKTSTSDRTAIVLKNADMMSDDGDGIINQTSATAGLDLRSWNSGSGTDLYPIWGTADDVELQPHGSYFFRPQQADSNLRICIEDNSVPTAISDASVQLVLKDDSTFDIFERNTAGTIQSILNTPLPTYDEYDLFEIRIEQIDPPTSARKIRYFKNATELTTQINPSADRYFPRPQSKLICLGSFDTEKKDSFIVDGGGTYDLANCLHAPSITITDAGSGYLDGEVITITSASLDATIAKITGVDATGGITGFQILEHGAGIDGAGETISPVGKISGANNCIITTGLPLDSVDITNSGGAVAYTLANANILLNDGITTVTNAVNISSVDGGGGVYDFTWLLDLTDQISVGDTLTIVQGTATDCTLTVNAVDSSAPSVADVKWHTIAPGIDEPLIKQSQAQFIPSTGFQTLTTLAQKQGDADPSLEATGTGPVVDGKETDQMLINVEEFQIKSICKEGGIQKAVASVPFGERENTSGTQSSGYFFYESYNLMYHQLENYGEENHNQLRVRITDAVGNPLSSLKHKTTITLDIRPRAI